jgi:endonuclease/exonuclease/phosphatase family metal-dependent hydrolase
MRRLLCISAVCAGLLAAPAQPLTIKAMQYNVLAFGLPCGSVNILDKYGWLGSVLDHYRPDLLAVNELAPEPGYTNGIRQLSFGTYTNRMAAAGFTNEAGSDRVNQLFYNTDRFGLKRVQVLPNSGIRDITAYTLYLRPELRPGTDTLFFTCLVAHLKAGDNASDVSDRNFSAQAIMAWRAAHAGQHVLLFGDLNIGAASEPAFQTLVSGADTALRFRDPAGKASGWTGPAHAAAHTQSTRVSSTDCGSAGGMDDRFDFILASRAVMNGEGGFGIVPGTYRALGNPGTSYDSELPCTGNSTVPSTVCINLRRTSDHLPVVVSLQVEGATPAANLLPAFRIWAAEPVSGSRLALRWEHPAGGRLRLRLMDLSGQLLREASVEASAGAWDWDAQALAPGLYVLRAEDAAGRSTSVKLMKTGW